MLGWVTTTVVFLGFVNSSISRCERYFRWIHSYCSRRTDQTTDTAFSCLAMSRLNATHQMIQYSLQVVSRWRRWLLLLPHPRDFEPLPISFWAQRIPPLLLYSAHSTGEFWPNVIDPGVAQKKLTPVRDKNLIFHLRVANSALSLLIHQPPLGSIARCIESNCWTINAG